MGSGAGKGDLRAAAERLERGITRFAEGDLAGALVEFEEALKLYPGTTRGKQFASWVRSVQNGSHADGLAMLDEEALRAVDEALDEPKPIVRPREPEFSAEPEPTRPERLRKPTPPPPTPPPPTPPQTPAIVMSERERRQTPPPAVTAASPPERSRRMTPPTRMETAATMTLPHPPPATPKVTRDPGEHAHESPWDPVPLTPGGSEVPSELKDQRRQDHIAELQSASTKAVAAPPGLKDLQVTSGPRMPPVRPGGSSSTILGMPALEPKLLTPQNRKRNKVAEDRPESVTREFRSATPTGPGLQPLDVPELTDEQIQGLLSLDSPLLPEGRTSPELDLDRIDGMDESPEERMIEMEALPTPLPHPAPAGLKQLKNDTNPMGVGSFGGGEFDPVQLTPTGIKPGGLKPVRESQPEDDPYSDLNLLPLEVAPDLSGPDEVEEGGTNPTNPFIRGTHASKMAQYTSYGASSQEPKLEDMPPLPKLPGTKTPGHPLGMAESALQAGDLIAAVDACEVALGESGGLTGRVARDHLPLVEQIYGAILGGPERHPTHGKAMGDLEPRSAFLLSRIDGSMTVEDVLDVSGMPRLEALRVMALLVRRGAVVIK